MTKQAQKEHHRAIIKRWEFKFMSFQPEADYLFTVFLGACNVPVQGFQDLRLLDKWFSARGEIAGSGSGELVDRDAVTQEISL